MSPKSIKRKRKLKKQTKQEAIPVNPDKLHNKKCNPQKKKAKMEKSFETSRKKQLLEANEEEDKAIRKLEVLLKLKKKKKKLDMFKDDGLDYVLGAIDRKEGESYLSDDSLDLDEDLAIAKGGTSKNEPSSPDKSVRPVPKQRTLSELLKEKCGESAEGSESEEFSDEDNEEQSEDDASDHDVDAQSDKDDSAVESTKTPETNSKPKVWQDIYGRMRDELGSVINDQEVKKYVPPSLRAKEKQTASEECIKIKRNLKGLLNRLSQSNLQNIGAQVEGLYMKHSRNNMNEVLYEIMTELLFSPITTPPRLIMEQAMLIALLHANVGSEVGAHFLQKIVEKLGELFKDSDTYGQGKECNNLLTFLSHLYSFKVTHCTLIFDIFHIFVESFKVKDIELIQLLLKNVGFALRKDDPLKLKELIIAIQAKATNFNQEQNDSRVKFMLEILIAIRNNNMYKIPDYDPTIMEHAKKFLRGIIRKGCSIQELAISYEDLLKVEERGRWWIVGSAWSNPNISKDPLKPEPTVLLKTEVNEKILALARKQHMNTDVRKSIFCILMTAEDYMDAFEKLLKLNLKNQQEREIIHVILHCSLKEKTYNPYYSYLLEKFCNFARKHMICLQFSLWDKFKELSNLKQKELNNLSRLLSHLFVSGALPLSVLKVIHFSDMDKTRVKFFRKILLAILLVDSDEACASVFARISHSENLKLLRESLRLFMLHFVLKNQSKLETDDAMKLEGRVKLAENALKPPKRVF